MGKLLIYLPEINNKTALHFYSTGASWKLRDYSSGEENVILSNRDSNKSVEDILSEAKFKMKADGNRPVTDIEFWKGKIKKVNIHLKNEKLMEFERECSDPIDLAINNDLEALKDSLEKFDQSEKLNDISLKLIEDVFKIEKIGNYDFKNGIALARRIIEYLLTDLCDRNGLNNAGSVYENIDLLCRHEILPDKIKNYFHFIRKFGNIGVHNKSNYESDFNITDVIIVRMTTAYLLKWYFDKTVFL